MKKMIDFNKHNYWNKSKVYSYSCLLVYIIIFVVASYNKINGNGDMVIKITNNTLYLSLLFSFIGILFIPKNLFVRIHIWVPILCNVPFFLSLIAVTHGNITEVISYYFESIINAPIRLIRLLFQI